MLELLLSEKTKQTYSRGIAIDWMILAKLVTKVRRPGISPRRSHHQEAGIHRN
jgi:hypothetical protein